MPLITSRGLGLLTFGTLCSWFWGCWSCSSSSLCCTPQSPSNQNLSLRETAPAFIGNNPWGNLDYVHFALEQPDSHLPDSTRRLTTPRWFFEGYAKDQLLGFLNSAGLTPEQRTVLMNPTQWEVSANGIYISPSRDVIRSLSAGSRQQIYRCPGAERSQFGASLSLPVPHGWVRAMVRE